MNAFQEVAIENYDNGIFSEVTSLREAERVGDTLFEFIVLELADSEGCIDRLDAIRRIQTAITQLHGVMTALSDMP